MSETAELCHSKIVTKINILEKCALELTRVEVAAAFSIYNEITAAKSKYLLSVSGILNEYYSNNTSAEARYHNMVSTLNINQIINNVSRKLEKLLPELRGIKIIVQSEHEHKKAADIAIPDISDDNFYDKILEMLDTAIEHVEKNSVILATDYVSGQLAAAANIVINVKIVCDEYKTCTCGRRMYVVAELSEMWCENCPRVLTLYGIVFRDDQFYTQEGQKSKHGKYEPNRYYKLWIDRIQGIETQIVPAELIARVKAAMIDDGVQLRTVKCERVREYLKKLRATDYNHNAAKIAREVSGISPPRLTRAEDKEANWKFNACMEEYDKVAPPGNRPYYPQFIYKILEAMFEESRDKLALLDYIHLQEDDTTIKNDKYFSIICDNIGDEIGIKFKPTIRG